MPRVTSQKIRQFILASGVALEEDITLDKVELFHEDGTPVELFDSSRMHWVGAWNVVSPYLKNDVVKDEGDLFVLTAESLIAGEISPSIEINPPPITIATPGTAGSTFAGSDIAYQLTYGVGIADGYAIDEDIGRMFYFDLATGGDILVEELLHSTPFMRIWDSTGTDAGILAENTGSWDPIALSDLPAGRYFVWVQEAFTGPLDYHLQVTLSGGAQFPAPAPANWALLVRGNDLLDSWSTLNIDPAPDFENSWGAVTDTDVQFRKRPDGTVEMRGRIDGGALGDAAFHLPVDCRPSRATEFTTPSQEASAWVQGVITIADREDGSVIPVEGGSDWISIACSFSVD